MVDTWRQEGFEEFRKGTFGNSGHNLYVSRAGVLQRIHHWDTTGNGHLDLVFCNSQDHWEKPPAYVYRQPLGVTQPLELPSNGAMAGAAVDLTGDGYDDLILGMWHNGVHQELNALVYFGGPDGLSERRTLALPAPLCLAVAGGDFDGDGRVDIAFLRRDGLRLYLQSALGLEPKRYSDLNIHGVQAAAADLDADGYADLVVRAADGSITIYWGGPNGIVPERCSAVPFTVPQATSENHGQAGYAEFVSDAGPLAAVVCLDGTQQVFVAGAASLLLVPVLPGRTFGMPLELPCGRPMAVAQGDVDGDGYSDLVVACRDGDGEYERSWVFWGGPDGLSGERRTALRTERACDVVVVDAEGGGCADIVICQSHRGKTFTSPSLLYHGSPRQRFPKPLDLPCQDARRVFALRSPDLPGPQIAFVNHFARGTQGDVDVAIYVGGADGYRTDRAIKLPGWGAVESLRPDLNDDGLPDVVLANCSENSVSLDPGSFVYFSTPNGLPTVPDLKLPTTRAHGVCCADLDGNGYLDLVFAGFNNPEILVFRGGPSGFDTANPDRIFLEHEGTVYKESRWIYLVDLNNDGYLDLVVPQILSDRSFILWGGPGGFRGDNVQALSVERAACARAADLTGNGFPDLILGGHNPTVGQPHDSFVYVYWNGPDGLSQSRRAMLPACGINALCLGDFNNNGLLDLFIGSYHKGAERDVDSFIYWNRQGRGFSEADRKRLFTHSASGCVAADLNGNGWTDLVVANHKVWGDHVGYSEIWWNGPGGFDPRKTTRLPTAGPHGMSAVEPGNIMDRGPNEYYESCPHELPDGGTVRYVRWEAETPARTYVLAQVRASETLEGLQESPWIGPGGSGTWFEHSQVVEHEVGGRWLQYRLALGAPNSCGSPRVTAVEITYAAE